MFKPCLPVGNSWFPDPVGAAITFTLLLARVYVCPTGNRLLNARIKETIGDPLQAKSCSHATFASDLLSARPRNDHPT